MLKQPFTYFTKAILILAVWFLSVQVADGQISAPQSDYETTVLYLSATEPDPLFVFYRDEGNTALAALTAQAPGSVVSSFDWSRYNALSAQWEAYGSETDVSSSSLSNIEEGGYAVRITNGSGLDTSFRAWVMLDRLIVSVDKTADGNTRRYNYTCDMLILSGTVTADTFYYYDPLSGEKLSVKNGFTFEWTSDNSDNKIYNPTTVLSPNTTYDPPVKDTWYALTATDSLGMQVDDSVFYASINTHAAFSIEYFDKDPDILSYTENPGKTDAPLTVRFINESENGVEFEWVFVDTAGTAEKITELTYELSESPEFIYYNANEYYLPYLISRSEDPLALEGCVDTFYLEEEIFVQPSDLNIPNVFTPNGDAMNDYFVFKHQSIKNCNVTIADRYGNIVYRKKIDDIYSWEGWNGHVLNTGREAPEGAYYYVVEALGYDDVEYRDPNIIEQWKINRQTSGTTGSTGTGETEVNTNKYTGWVYLFRYKGDF